MWKQKRILCLQGHGGRDVGAIHPDGKTTELSVTSKATALLAMCLKMYGYEAVLSRAGVLAKNEKMSLQERVDWANNIGGDILVEVHSNACKSHSAEGSEVFYYRNGKPLAEMIAPAIAILPKRDRGAKRNEHLKVIREVSMPAVLLELGFVDDNDNDDFDDRQWLLKRWPEQIGRAAATIHKYLEALK